MALAISIAWIVGWAVGAVVVAVAALLLLAVIALGRRIAGQADDIVVALDGAQRNTSPLFDVVRTNLALDRLAHGVGEGRGGER